MFNGLRDGINFYILEIVGFQHFVQFSLSFLAVAIVILFLKQTVRIKSQKRMNQIR
jgi:hypothetical protein